MDLPVDVEIPRLDRFLTERFPEVPRTRWTAWIAEGKVLVDGQSATKAGQKVRVGSVISTDLPDLPAPGGTAQPEQIELETLFEDERLWIVAKPAGMVVHPAPGHPGGTVLNALLGRMHATLEEARAMGAAAEDGEDEEFPAPLWPGLVHRLDRYTTGCLAMAKDREAQAALQAQFKARTVDKRYLAICRHSRKLPELGSLLIDAPIARHRVDRMKMTVNPEGRPAQTRIKVLARNGGLALVECQLMTGRTHQIRVHLAHLGAPLQGDPLYGGAGQWLDLEKQPMSTPHPLLHAWKLAVDHPDGRRIEVEAPLPQAFRVVQERMGLL
jgi:23S rRNA pseudouridine1911/1915/1917 synthase